MGTPLIGKYGYSFKSGVIDIAVARSGGNSDLYTNGTDPSVWDAFTSLPVVLYDSCVSGISWYLLYIDAGSGEIHLVRYDPGTGIYDTLLRTITSDPDDYETNSLGNMCIMDGVVYVIICDTDTYYLYRVGQDGSLIGDPDVVYTVGFSTPGSSGLGTIDSVLVAGLSLINNNTKLVSLVGTDTAWDSSSIVSGQDNIKNCSITSIGNKIYLTYVANSDSEIKIMEGTLN